LASERRPRTALKEVLVLAFALEQIEGVMPALMTPYGPDGAVNVDMIRRLVAYQLE